MKKLLLTIACLLALQPAFAVDWQASWIGAPWEGERFDATNVPPAPELRKTFDSSKKISKATAYVCGLGFFELRVNGVKAGDDVLSPNETSYTKREGLDKIFIALDDSNWRGYRVLYLTYDVTRLLRKGTNELSVLLGNGFYAIGSERWVAPYGTPRLICQVEVEYADGSVDTIVSDGSWQARRSPIILNDLYHGEVYDARLEDKGEWEPAALREAPTGALLPQDGPVDKVVEVLKPKSIVKLEDGRWEVDFGDYVSGWVRLKNFTAPEGTEISVEFPIETKGNGEYRYICKGGKVRSYAPRFCWWVFDKAIVSGWPGELKASNIVAEVVHSDVPVSAHFACSNPMLNKLNDIWRRTETDNMHLGVATDCPHREKGPYTGDGEVSCVAVMHNFAAADFYRKWLHDMSDCQDAVTGYVPNGAPWHPGCGGGVPWGSAMCVIPWEHYVHYGQLEVLEENYEQMCAYVGFMQQWKLEDGTMLQQLPTREDPIYWLNLGEWCPPYGLASENLVHTWYMWRCATYTAKAATALGRADDAARYQALADSTAAAFHKVFYNPETGSYGAGSGIVLASGYGTGSDAGVGDGSNIFALEMGVPEDRLETVLATVRSELAANDGHLNTGIYGTSLFFEVLCRYGLAEEAYAAMTKKDWPGYGWWIEQGAMTTWEQWNGKDSRNHPMFGGGLVWMYRQICGVQTDDAAPGYKHIILRPHPVGDLSWAEYDTDTAYGRLAARWDRKGGNFRLKLRVPAGTTATLYMPDGSDPIELGPGRRRISCKLD